MEEHIRFDPAIPALCLLDQRLLPTAEDYVLCRTPQEVAEALRRMVVRGAPAIGVTAAWGCVLALHGLPPGADWPARLDAALDYLEAHPDIPAVLTGGTGYGEEISEAQCMYDYLTEYGVEADRLILEDRASNTAENFALSKPLLYEAGVDPAEGRVAVVTNDFHIARSELIAAREGYGDVAGIPAPLPWVHLEINYTLREAFAMVKTFLFD